MSSSEALLAAAGVGTKYKNVQAAGPAAPVPRSSPVPPAKPLKRSHSGLAPVAVGPPTPAADRDPGQPSPLAKKGPPPPPPPKKAASTTELDKPPVPPPARPGSDVQAVSTASPARKSSLAMLSGFMKRASLSTKSMSSDGCESLPNRPYATGSEDGVKRLQELEDMMEPKESLASRVLLREGTLDKLNRDKFAPYHFILTTDALIYCTVLQGGEKIKPNRTLPLSTLLVAPSDAERMTAGVEFKLLTTIKSFYVKCETPEMRESWFTDIGRAARALQESVGKTPAETDMAPCFSSGVSTVFRRLSTQTSGLKLDCNVQCVYNTAEDNSKRLLELEEMMDREESLVSRVLLREGTLEKLNRDKFSSYHFILTTDALIYCTPNRFGDKLKHNRTLPLASLLVMRGDANRPNAAQEFLVMTPPKSFIVMAATSFEATSWVQEIEAAARLSGKVPDRASMAPLWETDGTKDSCTICNDEFTLLNRRHHCRNCGSIVCELCSKEKLRTKVDDKRLQRVCTRCAEQMKATRKYGVDAYA